MRLVGGDPWTISVGTDPDIDFCVWILEQDGLHVPPFDRHPEGDGALRAAGLEGAAWWAWFERNIAAIHERHEVFLAGTRRGQRIDVVRWRALRPAALWRGVPAVGERLTALSDPYEDVMNERKEPGRACELTLRDDQGLWDAMAPYRRSVPPLRVTFLGYPGPLRLVVPPQTILFGAAGLQPDGATLSAEILAGAAELSATAPRAWPS